MTTVHRIKRTYRDSVTYKDCEIEIVITAPRHSNKAVMLAELGAAMMDTVLKISESPEAEPVTIADLGLDRSIGDDLLIRALIGRSTKK